MKRWEVQEVKIEEMIAKNRADCSGCEACANICPKHCIEMKPDKEGFYYPNINNNECVKCGQCDATCPVLNYKEPFISKLPTALAAINKDWNIRRNSSSGGAFTALAEIILNRGGIVFGAAFNEDWQVVHVAANSIEELAKIRGSKYVQSRIGSIYRQVKAELETERQVLFSGTPCQVAGLKSFLKKDYDNLFLIDIACHGVTPPVLWQYYVNYRGLGHAISHIEFRGKNYGWENPLVKFIFKDRGKYETTLNKDLFTQAFQLYLNLRPACSSCHFKGLARFSDITLADFWNVNNILPEMYDNKGTSLILVHNEKGINLLNETGLSMEQANFKKTVEANPCIIVSCPADPRRAEFFNDLARFNPISVMDKYYSYNFGKQGQQVFELINRNCLLKWLEIERKYDLLPKESVLIVGLKKFDDTNRFIEQNIKNNLQMDKGVYILNQVNGEEKFTVLDLRYQGLAYNVDKNDKALVNFIQNVKITSIFIHNLAGFDLQFIVNVILRTKLPFKFFINDYFCVCPNSKLDCSAKYCSENMINPMCRHHFNEANLPKVSIKKWRSTFNQFLSQAEDIYVSSLNVANVMKKFYPHLKVKIEN